MCHHCHKLGNNRGAPPHRSVNCRDPRNCWSNNYRSIKDPIYQNDCRFFIRYCPKCKCNAYHIMHSNGNELDWPRCMDHT